MSLYKFSTNLKNLRLSKGLTQKQLSDILNVSRQTISNYENGSNEPDFYMIAKIADYFNCSIDSLVFDGLNTNLQNINDLLNINKLLVNKDTLIKQLLDNKALLYKNIEEIDTILSVLDSLKITNIEYSNELSTFNKIDNKSNNIMDFSFYKNTKIIRASNYKNIENHDDFFKIPFIGQVSAGYPAYAYEDIEKYFYIPKEYRKYNEDDYFILRIKGESMNKIYKNGDYVLVRKTCCIDENKPSVVLVNNEEATVKYVMLDDEYFYLQPYSDSPKYQENMSYKKNENKLNIIGTVIGVVFEKEE